MPFDPQELKRLHESATQVVLEFTPPRAGDLYVWLNGEVIGTAGRMRPEDAAKIAYLWNHAQEIVDRCDRISARRIYRRISDCMESVFGRFLTNKHDVDHIER